MAAPTLERLMRTCIRQDAEWVGIKRSEVPRIQLKDAQRTLAIDPIVQADVDALAARALELGGEPRGAGNQVRCPITHEGTRFEAVIIGGASIEELWLLRSRPVQEEP